MTRAINCGATWLLLMLAFWLPGCLDPRANDEPGYSHRVLPDGQRARALEDNDRLLATISGADGLAAERIALRTGFVAGETVTYWDFGESSDSAGLAWIFRKRTDDEDGLGNEIGHPALVDTAPGDDDYGPLRNLSVVYITDDYRGELIPSFAALEDAVELGIVDNPAPTETVVAWPMTRPDVELELRNGDIGRPTEVLYRGHRIPCFTLESFAPPLGEIMLSRGSARAASAYTMRRQWQTDTLDEADLEADLNDDGDMLDSNLVFTAAPGDMGYTGLVSIVDVTVPKDYAFGDVTAEDDLFMRGEGGTEPVPETVVEFSDSGDVYFRPILPE